MALKLSALRIQRGHGKDGNNGTNGNSHVISKHFRLFSNFRLFRVLSSRSLFANSMPLRGSDPEMRRGERLVSQGFTLWFTGLSGAGKTTLTNALVPQLRARGVKIEVLDGDEVR